MSLRIKSFCVVCAQITQLTINYIAHCGLARLFYVGENFPARKRLRETQKAQVWALITILVTVLASKLLVIFLFLQNVKKGQAIAFYLNLSLIILFILWSFLFLGNIDLRGTII